MEEKERQVRMEEKERRERMGQKERQERLELERERETGIAARTRNEKGRGAYEIRVRR